MTDSKKHARTVEEDASDLEQTLKRIKTEDGFVRQHYSLCCEMKTALESQIETVDRQDERRKREREQEFYYYESIGKAIERSHDNKNWVQDDEVEYADHLCQTEDCWYGRHEGRRSGFSIFRLPGFDYTICDVCFQNGLHTDSGGFEDWLREENGITLESNWDEEYKKNQDGIDVSQYENETLGERAQRALLKKEWDNDSVLENCFFKDGQTPHRQPSYRLIGTTYCLCYTCFMDESKRAQLAKSIVTVCDVSNK